MLKNATINGKKHWVISEEEYSVLVNLAATAGIMYAGKVDEKKLPWPTFEGQILPEMVEKFIETHDLDYQTYEDDLKRFVEDAFAPILRKTKKTTKK